MVICRQGRIRIKAAWARRDQELNLVYDQSERKAWVQVSLKVGVGGRREEDDIYANVKQFHPVLRR